MAIAKQLKVLGLALVLCSLLFLAVTSYAQSEVLGEIQFVGATKVEKTSGVWVDGQYVGYLKELKGSKKVLLLPGEHEIAVRQSGYKDFTQKVLLEPGQNKSSVWSWRRTPELNFPRSALKSRSWSHPTGLRFFWTTALWAMCMSSAELVERCW